MGGVGKIPKTWMEKRKRGNHRCEAGRLSMANTSGERFKINIKAFESCKCKIYELTTARRVFIFDFKKLTTLHNRGLKVTVCELRFVKFM